MLTDPDDLRWRDQVDSFVFTIPSIFSFFGCVFVVLSVLLMKKLQTLTFMIIAFQMTAEGLYNLTMAVFLYPPKDKTPLCVLQGFMQAWTLNMTILLTAFMSYHMYRCITRKTPASYTLTNRRLYITTGLVALYSTIVATVPLFRNGYGIDGSQCWLASRNTHLEHTIFTSCVLYAPLWLCIGYSLVSYVTIFKYVKKISREAKKSEGAGTKRTKKSSTEKVVVKLMYYPGIMIFCWTGITIIRVHAMFHKRHQEAPIFMWLAHGVVQLQGVLDAAVFASYPSVKHEYRMLFARKLGHIYSEQSGTSGDSSGGRDSDIDNSQKQDAEIEMSSLSSRPNAIVTDEESTHQMVVRNVDDDTAV